MAVSFLTLLVGLLVASASGLRSERRAALDSFTLTQKTPSAFKEPSADVESKNFLPLKMGGPSRTSKLLTSPRRAAKAATAETTGSAALTNIEDGLEFIVPIKIYEEELYAIVDTGSSDTWAIRKGFTCYNYTETGYVTASEASCEFGPTYNGTFEGGQIKDVCHLENFNITYGDGEYVVGVLGYSHVTVAGITVVHQEIALGDEAYWEGDGVSSGIMGLAYEALTSAFSGTNPAVDNVNTSEEYSPLFKSMYTQGLVAPIFSIALERTTSTSYEAPGGYIAFGGYPPISFTETFTSTPIQILELTSEEQEAAQYSFYAITPTAWVGGRAGRKMSKRQHGGDHGGRGEEVTYIVDSGTTLVYAPGELAEEIAELYDPPAFYFDDYGLFFAFCDATPPALGVEINGTAFYINPADVILQTEGFEYDGYDLCLTGVQDGDPGPYILGDVFLTNVVATFDVGAAEMRFAPHETY